MSVTFGIKLENHFLDYWTMALLIAFVSKDEQVNKIVATLKKANITDPKVRKEHVKKIKAMK